jgi:predicted secreted hydrolase
VKLSCSLAVCTLFALATSAAPNGIAGEPSAVLPGVELQFPRDYGSHPSFGIEWWYLTGWVTTASHESLGFQITFFRSRVASPADNPSAFTARQLLIGHCAISDPARGHLWQDQRIRRAGMGLAQASVDDTQVWIDDWQLERHGDGYHARVAADDFALDLLLSATQPPMRNGELGFSQKGPAPASASYYYSEPQLRVAGRIGRAGKADVVSGVAWLDHEWSSQYLDPNAVGWDWVGLNLDDGGALMAFRIRDHEGRTYWSAGTLRDAEGHTRSLSATDLDWHPERSWHSPRTGVDYPVQWQLDAAGHSLELTPLIDDQEIDTRLSTGAIYWEGAIRVQEHAREIGRGYLELTGYGQPLTLR